MLPQETLDEHLAVRPTGIPGVPVSFPGYTVRAEVGSKLPVAGTSRPCRPPRSAPRTPTLGSGSPRHEPMQLSRQKT